MSKNRRNHNPKFKAKVAMEAVKGELTVSELSKKYEIHPTQIAKWKKAVLQNVQGIFEGKITASQSCNDNEKDELYNQIGKLQVKVNFLEKVSGQM